MSKNYSDLGKHSDGRSISQISAAQAQSEEQEPETFVEKVTKQTMKVIQEERLDSVGYEMEQNTLLDVQLDDKQIKQEGVPLSGLVTRVKEVSGLMPILKKVYSKQIEMEMIQHRFMAACDDNYLYKEQLDVDFGSFQAMIMKMVKDHLDENRRLVNERLSICPTEESVKNRLMRKANDW